MHHYILFDEALVLISSCTNFENKEMSQTCNKKNCNEEKKSEI